MVQNPPEGNQRIVPYLYYEDGLAALEFMRRVFGFEQRLCHQTPSGAIIHAEAGLDGNVVMLGSPQTIKGQSFPVRYSGVMCYVDDVDAHYARAKAEGATITAELATAPYGDRGYTAVDPEGHVWFFATHIFDAPVQASEPAAATA